MLPIIFFHVFLLFLALIFFDVRYYLVFKTLPALLQEPEGEWWAYINKPILLLIIISFAVSIYIHYKE